MLRRRHLGFYSVPQLLLLLSTITVVVLIQPAHSSEDELFAHSYTSTKHDTKNNHVSLETLKHEYKPSTDISKEYGSDSMERSTMKELHQKASGKNSVKWAMSFGSLGDDSVQAILPDPSGRVYLAGVFEGDLSIEGLPTVSSNGGIDFFVLSVSPNGTMESIISFGGTGDDWANSMDWNPDGNITIVGRFSGTWDLGTEIVTSVNYTDIFILKITPTGEVVWILQVGGPADDNANDVAVLSTGEIIVVGSFQQYIDFGPLGSTAYSWGSDDMLILWVYDIGTIMTYKAYGSSGMDAATGIALSVSLGQVGVCAIYSGYIVIEDRYHTASDIDVLIILYWNNGTYIDSTSFGSGVDDGFEDVVVDTAGNVYVVGYYTNGAVAAVGGRDIVIIKFTENAAFLWYKLFGGPEDDMAYAIGVDAEENIYIVGATGGDIDFGSGPIPSKGSSDMFSIKLDPLGNLLEATTYGGVNNDTAREIAIVNGSAIIAGTFVGSITIGSTTMESKGATDMTVFKVATSSSGSSGKSKAGVIAAAVVVPVVVIAIGAALAFVFIKRRAAYRKNVLAVARESELRLPAQPEANYQPVIAAENMSNQSLNFSLSSHNSSNQSFKMQQQPTDSNYSALNGSRSVEHQYEGIGGPMSAELYEIIKSQGLTELANSSWLIDFRQIQIQQKIGSGAFGAVFKAIWRGVPVAVKQSNTEVAIQDFISEAEILTKLRPHPNITQFLGICPSPFCLIFEFVPNGSLFSFLMNKSKEMDINLKIKILRGVVAGMIHLHSEGIVHRDLAARNILLDGTFTPKVCDFGLSRATGGATMGHTASEIGPIKWMAPEAILKRIYSPKTDIWSFGVVIFEVLERQVPYPDLSVPQVAAYITQISLLQSIPEGHSHPEALIEMMQQCLQLDPVQRPTFEDLIQQFDDKFGQQH